MLNRVLRRGRIAMLTSKLPARTAVGGRLIAALLSCLLAAESALAQNGIPVFETKYALRYRFPTESTEILPGAFRTTIVGSERITRDQRVTSMRYDGAIGFTVGERELSSSDSLPDSAVDLYVRLRDVRLECDAGRGSYSFVVNEQGMREVRPMAEPVERGPHDQYVGSHTVASLLAKPSTLRFANGALLAAPTVSPMLQTLDCAWMYTGVTAMFPPLPSKPIPTGQVWKAGMPVRLSVFGQPQIIRFDVKFEEYDESTHVAVVSWSTTLASTSVIPAPGIHHIGADAVATGTINGRVRLHVRTGIVLSSEMRLDLGISHIKSSNTTVRYAKVYTLKNLDHTDPAELNMATADPVDQQP